MKQRFCLMLLLPAFLCQPGVAQRHYRFADPQNDRLTLSFSLSQNLIIIPSRINRSSPLQFVLDSGIGNTIITGITPNDSLTLHEAQRIQIGGLGSGIPLEAFYSINNQVDIEHPDDSTNRISGYGMDVYVLSEDQFELSRQLGIKVNGLLGSDLFNDMLIMVDPVERTITFLDRKSVDIARKTRSYTRIPLTVLNGKAYVDVQIQQENGSILTVRLLLDTGASLAFWIAPSADPSISVPQKTIRSLLGQGLNGPVNGVMGKITRAWLGPFQFKRPLVSYPDSTSIAGLTLNASRHGSIGNEILRRFNCIYDFAGGAMYLKPNRFFKSDFTYNRSGMAVEKLDPGLPVYSVYSVMPGSPADQAGIREGDFLEHVDYVPAFSLSLDDINNILYGESGNLVILKINRNGEILKVSFRLEGKL